MLLPCAHGKQEEQWGLLYDSMQGLLFYALNQSYKPIVSLYAK